MSPFRARNLALALRVIDRGAPGAKDPLLLARMGLVLRMHGIERRLPVGHALAVIGVSGAPMVQGPLLAAAVGGAEQLNVTEATSLLVQAMNVRPKDATILSRMAEIAFRMGRPRESGQMLDEAMALNPTEPVVRREIGDALVATQRLQLATRWFEKMVHDYPMDNELRNRLAEVTVWSGAYAQGLDRLTPILEEAFDRRTLWPVFVDAISSAKVMTKAQTNLAMKIAVQPSPFSAAKEPVRYLSRLAWALTARGNEEQQP